MQVMNVVLYPDAPLKDRAEPVKKFGPELAQLAESMFETMYTFDGVGLAGPQVGLNQRILVLHDVEDDIRMCLVNPEILESEGQAVSDEGCLSLPEIFAPVPRATRIRVRARDEFGKKLEFEAKDFLARIIQHECDHLDGVIFLDRTDVLTRQAKLQEWSEVRSRLGEGTRARVY